MAADILVKTDMASMANGLELRSPFLDLSFANFCLSLPPNFKVSPKNSKIILREAMKPYLPVSILKKNKQGFGEPNNWQKTPSVLALKKEFLDDPTMKMFNYLPYKEVNELICEKNRFWEFLVLSVWFEQKYKAFK
jgi:asparagine synthase (glutamine-hydrolysing)